ncbi:INO80 complex subunit D [Cylas formicarius]|uniref:INO80 complex subunit D n=1 Tax=Cylas formicarius TaxID=197179 RepID=UPI00295888CB|nr:INO80 complex subunit D [Cylas formicarius]
MFNSGIKGNQRCNGVFASPSVDLSVVNDTPLHNISYKFVNKLDNKDLYSARNYGDQPFIKSQRYIKNSNNNLSTKVTTDVDQNCGDKSAVHSIIGLSDSKTHNSSLVLEHKIKSEKTRSTHHEALQRIECEKDIINHYQQHWFSVSLEKFKLEDRSREERIEITRHEFLRHIQQIQRSNIGKRNRMPDWIVKRTKRAVSHKNKNSYNSGLIAPKYCEVEECSKPALSCARLCSLHIMLDTRQVLFEYCTAKFADNTQCSMPVFDISHELPLCAEHARKRDNYRLYQEAKPKKIRKKVKPSAMIRPQKRNKKKKKSTKSSDSSLCNTGVDNTPFSSSELSNEMVQADSPELEEDLQIDHVLALNENGLEQALVTQGHLLEETDISNVLSTIQVDEFSDFFNVNRNGEYEPSREEAEELEKALAAVDNDVKSLEKLSQTQGLLDSLLDEHTLAETLVQIPDMFHNGYTQCGDNMVTQTASYLLPVEPHSHS